MPLPILSDQPVKPVLFYGVIIFFAVAMVGGSGTPWVGISLFASWAIFILTGFAVLPALLADPDKNQNLTEQQATWILLNTATGLCVALFLWLGSGYIFHTFWPGTAALLIISALGLFRLVHQQKSYKLSTPTGILFAVIIIAFLLGLYHYWLIEFHWQDSLIFSGIYRGDLFFHTYWATLIKENGLPLIDMTGNPSTPFELPTHIGIDILMAGIQNLTRISMFQTTRILVPIGYSLLGLFALSVVYQPHRKKILIFIAAISILVWGGLSLPLDVVTGNIRGILIPYVSSTINRNGSGSLYHSLTQIFSVALTGAALVAMRKHILSDDLRYFILANVLIGTTLLVKPSISILTAPAMFIFLLLDRRKLYQSLIAASIFIAAIAIYMLPIFFQDSYPEVSAWTLGANLDSLKDLTLIIIKSVVWIGVGWVFIGIRLKHLIRSIIKRGPLDWEDFLLIVIGGGLLFFLLFEESGIRGRHGNNLWGLFASLILVSPIALVSLVEWVKDASPHSVKAQAKKWIVLTMLSFQLLSGTLYAFSFPIVNMRHHRYPNSIVRFLKDLRAQTPPQTRFLFDPSFPFQGRFMVYLARPALWKYSSTPHSKKWFEKWESAIEGKADPWSIIRHYDALVIGPATRWIIPLLEEKNWRKTQTSYQKYELWQAPDQNFLQQ